MRLDLPRSRAGRGLSLTPLIDVVFILLLFFLLASHFDRWRTLRLDTATVTTGEQDADRSAVLRVRLHADGTLLIDGVALDPNRLQHTLEDHRARLPDISVVLEAEAEVRLQPLVGLIDTVTAAGIRELSLR
ncbi:MAG: biopolymer transporter ExbD [Sphingobacteriia bacterium]|nr:biopolymer transporter ExbD [Sphingobacteriia bacterium]